MAIARARAAGSHVLPDISRRATPSRR